MKRHTAIEDMMNKYESDRKRQHLRLSSSCKIGIRLRAVRDFNFKDLTQREETEFEELLSRRSKMKELMKTERNKKIQEKERLVQLTTVTKEINDEQLHLQDQNEIQQILNERLEMITDVDTDHFMEVHGLENTEKPKDLHFERPEENINPYDAFLTSANQSNRITEDTTYTQNHEEDIKTVELETFVQKTFSVGQETNRFDDNSHIDEVDREEEKNEEKDNQTSLSDSVEINESDGSVDSGEETEPRETDSYDFDFSEHDPNGAALTIKRGDRMVTIPPPNIGDKVGWWMVKHLARGEIGFIPRYTVVIEHVKESSKTTLHDLPMEIFDIFLQKSCLHWILYSPAKQRDKEVVRSLSSVDVCFFRRITRKRFQTGIWRYLKHFYGKTKSRSAAIRNNRNYLLENIQPNLELMALLLSHNCINNEQSHFFQRQISNHNKNAKLLYILDSFDEIQLSNFVKCLRQNEQQKVARIVENGGGATKIELQSLDANRTMTMEAQLSHQKIKYLRYGTKSWSHDTYKFKSQLKEDGVEILSSRLEKRTVVVWIWCRSQKALEYIQKLYESNELRDVLFENIQPSSSTIININRNQFKKTIVVCPFSINFTQRIEMQKEKENGLRPGVTKLRNKIYMLCQWTCLPSLLPARPPRPPLPRPPYVIHVFEDQNPFNWQKEIELTDITHASIILSNEKENCLYVIVSFIEETRVWKITREGDDGHRILKWFTLNIQENSLSMMSNGRFFSLNWSTLMIYGSDGELIRSIKLTFSTPLHAEETSIGNFILLHRWSQWEGESESNREDSVMKWGICELSSDGQTVIRDFIASSETQQLYGAFFFLLDSEDRVFVSDSENDRVILLDPDLKWNRILIPSGAKEEPRIRYPGTLCYDEEKNQLIVEGEEVNVYSLSRK